MTIRSNGSTDPDYSDSDSTDREQMLKSEVRTPRYSDEEMDCIERNYMFDNPRNLLNRELAKWFNKR